MRSVSSSFATHLVNRRNFLRTLPLASLYLAGCSERDQRVVLYCAQDREYAETILSDFKADTGLEVATKFDTEAQKSVSLFEEIRREGDRPRCCVFWNNEVLNTIRLQRLGRLESYDSPAGQAFPDWSRVEDRTFQMFAARPRVLIVNKNLLAPGDYPRSILDLTQPRWKGRIAIAKPQFGTTATQAACLFECLGPAPARDFYRRLHDNGVVIVPGNRQTADGVAEGRFAAAFTDSDDAIVAMEAGKPVDLVLPDSQGHADHPRLGTLLIPNTLCLIRGAANQAGGKKLIDYLLSPATESRLAEGGGYQLPLNPGAKGQIHPGLKRPEEMKLMQVSWPRAADLWEETQEFLRAEFAR